MAQPIALLLGSTKMVERHMRRALPAEVGMLEVRSLEAAMRKLDEGDVRIIVFGPTQRRALAEVVQLRANPGTARVPLVVVYRDDQRTDVQRHLQGPHRGDAYVMQSRAQRELEDAVSRALLGPTSDLGVPSEQLEELPPEALSALTRDVSSLARAARHGGGAGATMGGVETTLELDVIDMEEVEDDDADGLDALTSVATDAGESDTVLMDVVELDAIDDEPELAASSLVHTGENDVVEALDVEDDIDVDALELVELEELTSDVRPPPMAATSAATILPDELPMDDIGDDIEELDAESDDPGATPAAAWLGEMETVDASEVAEDLTEELTDVTADPATDGPAGAVDEGGTLSNDDLAVEDAEVIELADVSDISDVSDFSQVTDEGPGSGPSAASDAGHDVFTASTVTDLDLTGVADAPDAPPPAPAALAPIAPAEQPQEAPAAAAAALAPAGEQTPTGHRQRHASSTELLSNNLTELTTLISKLQAALADIDRLEAENAELRVAAQQGANSDDARNELAVAAAERDAARAELAAAVAERDAARAERDASQAACAAAQAEARAAMAQAVEARAHADQAAAKVTAGDRERIELRAELQARDQAVAAAAALLRQATAALQQAG